MPKMCQARKIYTPETELNLPADPSPAPMIPVVPPTEELLKAKTTSRFGLPFDFPNHFSFKKAKPKVNPPSVPLALPDNDSFDSNNTEDLLQSLASTTEPHTPLPELPTITPEEVFYDSLGSMGDADSVQEDPYPGQSGWDDPDYPPSEPLSTGISPDSHENPEIPPHLIVKLTKEEWVEVQIYGLQPKQEDPWEFCPHLVM